MLAILAILFAVVMALCFLVPIIGIPLLILTVILYHFTIGYFIELWKIYKEHQNT